MGSVVASALYQAGRRVGDVEIEQLDLDHCDTLPPEPGRFVWIGLHEPDEATLRKVQLRFGLHDLAIEDAHLAHQRPKLEAYGDSLFLVLRTVQLVDGQIGCGETHIFAGRGHVVTIRHGSGTPYGEVRGRCERAPRMLALGEIFVVYSIMDFVVDSYFPVLHALEEEIDGLEAAVFEHRATHRELERTYALRHELMTMRRSIAPLSEVCNRMMRFDTPLVEERVQPYFRDVQDHVLRVIEHIDSLRELLTSALEANLLFATQQQNEVMRRFAGWAAILAVPTAVAGIYGMNFEHMPELHQPLAYPAVLAGIGIACGVLFWRFRRAGWV
jgi:magnesium transporter